MKTPHMTATEHLNIMKQTQIDGSSSVCSAKCTNVAYISASVIILKSVSRHSSWNRSRAAALTSVCVCVFTAVCVRSLRCVCTLDG